MKLLTKELREKLLAQSPTDEEMQSEDGPPSSMDKLCHLKLFNPIGSWTWYACEMEVIRDDAGNEIDVRFFGFVDGTFPEMGYFSLKELESVKLSLGMGIERDIYWTPKTLRELAEGKGVM